MPKSAVLSDPSLYLLVGPQPGDSEASEASPSEDLNEQMELLEEMKRVCLGVQKAPPHVVGVIEAAIAVCREWKSRPRGRDVPLPPPSKLSERQAPEVSCTDSQENLKSIAYTPCLSAPQSVLSMLGVKKENAPEASGPA